MISNSQKYKRVSEWIVLNDDKVDDVTIQLLANHFDVLNSLDVIEIPTAVKQAISRIERLSLDCGGNSKTARELDVMCQDLASEGLIRECETTSDIEEALMGLAEANRKIKEQLQESKSYIDEFYSLHVQVKKVKKLFGYSSIIIFVVRLFARIMKIINQPFFLFIQRLKQEVERYFSKLKRLRLLVFDHVNLYLLE